MESDFERQSVSHGSQQSANHQSRTTLEEKQRVRSCVEAFLAKFDERRCEWAPTQDLLARVQQPEKSVHSFPEVLTPMSPWMMSPGFRCTKSPLTTKSNARLQQSASLLVEESKLVRNLMSTNHLIAVL